MADQLDPRHSYGPAARGLAQVERNDFDQALATVREQLKTKRDDAFLYYLLAEIQ
jgi:Flp pilus assembly protein TadD